MEKDSFIMYRSFYKAICDLDKYPKIQIQLFKAMCELGLNNNEIELEGLADTLFTLIKPQIQANNKRFENGKKGASAGQKGGRPKKEIKKENPIGDISENPIGDILQTPNNNVNVNENVNVNVNVNENKNINVKEIHVEQSSSSVSLQKENNILIPDNTPTNTNQKKRSLKNYTADFDKFWQLYKGVGSKSKAFEYWQKIKKTIDVERIYQAVEIYNQELTEEKYRKHAEGWLNQRLDTYLEKIDNPNLISLSEERAVKEQRIVEEEHERLRLQYVREEKAERYRLYEMKDPNYAKWQMPYTMYEYLQKHGASKAVLQYHKNLQINREAV